MPESMGFWPDSLWSWVLVALVATCVLYIGRSEAHGAFRALGSALRSGFETASRFVMSAHDRLTKRNREVLLEMGRESTERLIEREFQRVGQTVERDLASYPALHRKLSDQITQIDEDYHQSTEVPPSPPEWTKAVEAVASLPSSGDPLVSKILGDISRTLDRSHRDSIDVYRKASTERHGLLRRMLPYWRRLDMTLGSVSGAISGLRERAETIDRQMGNYEQITQKTDQAVRMLSASSMTHFITSALVLVIAVLGAFINFHLIALPMSEMVGSTSYIGPLKTSDIAALVIITTELAMGLFLMESLRITRLFPVINRMDDVMRVRMVWISLGILFTLACVESSLAYMRDMLAADREALRLSLAGVEAGAVPFRWIPAVGQMVMGFMLPFALAFAAIPLESFIQSSRVIVGDVVALVLRGFSATLELTGQLAGNLAPMLIHLYDFMILGPLWIEKLARGDRPPESVQNRSSNLERTVET